MTSEHSSEGGAIGDPAAILAAWRARGDHRRDPVRFHFIEALARRAAAHHGEARRVLDDRLHRLLAAYGEDLGETPGGQSAAAAAQPENERGAGLLAGLLDHIDRQALPEGTDPLAGQALSGRDGAPRELKALGYFRSTWSRLSADRRLTQSLAAVPENAGPLNSHQLVHRALTLMRELSPEYLHRFMSHVDTLLWLERASAAGAAPGAETPRAEGRRKSARGKGN